MRDASNNHRGVPPEGEWFNPGEGRHPPRTALEPSPVTDMIMNGMLGPCSYRSLTFSLASAPPPSRAGVSLPHSVAATRPCADESDAGRKEFTIVRSAGLRKEPWQAT